jgi:release factor glutamine methyltransferase
MSGARRLGSGSTVARAAVVASLTEQLGSAQEARWILDHAGDRWPELVQRRLAGEPLQYLLGSWPFRHLELVVDRRVLIPRPETEQVVEVALAELGRICRSPDPDDASRHGEPRAAGGRVCVDLGTGSGAIALSLADEGRAMCRDLDVWATDVSADALVVARQNLAALAVARPVPSVRFVQGWWFDALPRELAGRIDLVVSNPPYVAEAEFAGLDSVVRDWEPRQALVAAPGSTGVGGTAAIEAIIDAAPDWLGPDGAMVIELDPDQASVARAMARRARFGRVVVERDLAGRDRVLVARR